MKICTNCNNVEADTSKFCSNCGSSSFRDEHSIDNEIYNSQTNYEFLTDETIIEAKKRRKKKMLSMLGVLALILIVLVFVTAIKVTHDSKVTKPSNDYTNNTEIPYSEGIFENSVYVNNWADIKIELPESWSEASQKQYSSYEDEITTCDFYAENSDGDLLSILFINLSSNDTTYSEDEILREMTTGISSKLENPNTTEPLYQLLGNQLYLYSDVEGKINDKDMCITSYVRFQDEYAIVINITSKNPENNHSISASIDSCN